MTDPLRSQAAEEDRLAAAPDSTVLDTMRAAVWDEGYGAGQWDGLKVYRPNPYRAAQTGATK